MSAMSRDTNYAARGRCRFTTKIKKPDVRLHRRSAARVLNTRAAHGAIKSLVLGNTSISRGTWLGPFFRTGRRPRRGSIGKITDFLAMPHHNRTCITHPTLTEPPPHFTCYYWPPRGFFFAHCSCFFVGFLPIGDSTPMNWLCSNPVSKRDR